MRLFQGLGILIPSPSMRFAYSGLGARLGESMVDFADRDPERVIESKGGGDL